MHEAYVGQVLVFDDNVAASHVLRRQLTAAGWEAEVVATAEEAREILSRSTYDALLIAIEALDDAPMFVEYAQSLSHAPAVLVLTSNLDARSAARVLRAGAVDALRKPIEPAELVNRVSQAVGLAQPAERDASRGPFDAADHVRGETRAIRALRRQLRVLGRLPSFSVAIEGPPGSGKTMVAELIHSLRDKAAPFITLNCRTRPKARLHELLFEAGSQNVLSQAVGGILVLDHVLDLPVEMQTMLLGRIHGWPDEGMLTPDSELPRSIISLSHQSFSPRDARFVSQLYYRLAGFTMQLQPLSERREDIALLAGHFVATLSKRPLRIMPGAMQALRDHDWPDNVRELKQVVERSCLRCDGERITEDDVRAAIWGEAYASREEDDEAPPDSFRSIGRHMIQEAIDSTNGNMSEAARKLGIPRSTLRDKVRRHGLKLK